MKKHTCDVYLFMDLLSHFDIVTLLIMQVKNVEDLYKGVLLMQMTNTVKHKNLVYQLIVSKMDAKPDW